MTNRQKKHQEYMNHLAEKNWYYGEACGYGGLVIIGIFGIVLSTIVHKKNAKKQMKFGTHV